MAYKNFKINIFFIIVLIFLFSIFSSASAQSSPEFLVSWEAENYAPVWYSGKILPIAGTKVGISFNLFEAGRPVSLLNNTIRWYVNGKLVQNENDGLGIKSLKTTALNDGNNQMSVRITIIDYADEILNKTVVIPVVKPQVVIDSPYSNNNIRTGLSIFKATPFFFNVLDKNSLAVNWSANGVQAEGASGDPWQLDLNINNPQPGTKINLSVLVKNLLNYLELVSQNIILQIK